MMLRLVLKALLAGGLFLVGCNNTTSSTNPDEIENLEEPTEEATPIVKSRKVEKSIRDADDLVAAKEVEQEVTAWSTEMIHRDILASLRKFEVTSDKRTLTSEEIKEYLKDENWLASKLRSDDNKWFVDKQVRRSVIGKTSIVVALFVDVGDQTFKTFSEALGKNEEATFGDLVMLDVLKQTVAISERKPLCSGFQVKLLQGLASRSNKLHRIVGLYLCRSVRLNNTQLASLKKIYSKGKDPLVTQFAKKLLK